MNNLFLIHSAVRPCDRKFGQTVGKPPLHANDKGSVRTQKRYLTLEEIDRKVSLYLAASDNPVDVELLPTWINIWSTCTRPVDHTMADEIARHERNVAKGLIAAERNKVRESQPGAVSANQWQQRRRS